MSDGITDRSNDVRMTFGGSETTKDSASDQSSQVKTSTQWFLDRMIAILNKNSFKGDWRQMPFMELVRLMELEVFELKDLIEAGGATPEEIIDECVDIANFCLFIADLTNTNSKEFSEYQTYLKLKEKAERGEFGKFEREEEEEDHTEKSNREKYGVDLTIKFPKRT